MHRTIKALLVGIDRYLHPVPPLNGCVNDIEAFANYLQQRVAGTESVRLDLRVLMDDQATRKAVIAGFREHLSTARKGDVALFYYAGHGSQEQAPPEFWHLEPDRLNETLVCYDSRSPGGWDLADKELAKLIDEVAVGGAHVVLILDCCHAASATRNLDLQGTVVRRVPTDLRKRPLESFLVRLDEVNRHSGTRGLAETTSDLSVGRHILLAACRDNEEALEYNGEGRPRGAFSYFLGHVLRSATGPLTYRDFFAQTSALLRSTIKMQSPQIEATNPADLDALFLDGAIRPSVPYFSVAACDGHWVLQAGAAHGLPRGEGAETVELALFPFDAPPDHLTDLSKAVGRARVVEVLPTSSLIELSGDSDYAETATFKAVIVRLPLPALAVQVTGDDVQGVAWAREAIAHAGLNGASSLYVREANAGELPEFRLLAQDGQYLITSPGNDRPLVGQIDGYSEANALKAVRRLEHMARWALTARLANPGSSIRPGEVEMTILQGDQELVDPEIRLEYRYEGGKWVPPQFKVRLTNKGDRRLFVALLNLTETYKISAGLQDGGSVRLEPGETAWAYRGRPIPATVPNELWKQGVIEFRDVLKLIICTDEFDARLMEQLALDVPRKAPIPTHSDLNGTLGRLMSRVQTRDLGGDDPTSLNDWAAASVVFTTVRPLESSPVPAAGSEPVTLAGGVTLHAHLKLSAKVRLTAAPTASRDLGNLALPRLLRDDPTISQPFVVTPTRGGSPGLSVLELTDVQNREAVTPEEPLRLEVSATTAEGEYILPVGFDGEFFLPLGRAVRNHGGTEIVIERLPGDQGQSSLPEAARRSLGGSIKIFFQKVVCGVLGREFEYPILAAADVDETGGKEQVIYEKDAETVRARVSQARKILLLIHGVIGDTLEIRRGMRRAKVGPEKAPIDSLYDLVLTFDYENLNTPIEDVARKLKERLEAVGLGPEHDKELTIVAHSMGGLVSRWFIEREEGNKVVKRLVMCGTPNGGSPWPNVHDWAISTLAIGLNGLAALAWPASVVGGLVAAIERVDVNLDQMQPGSPFLKELTHSLDPSVPYVMLSGDTSLVPAAMVIDRDGLSPVGRLLARLLSKPVLHGLADTLFRDQANDVAVSVVSMRDVPGPWNPAYDVQAVPCDHMSYFRYTACLNALTEVLSRPIQR